MMRRSLALAALCGLAACVELAEPGSADAGAQVDAGELTATDAGAFDAGATDAGPPFRSTPATAYRTQTVRGWVVRVANDLEGTDAGAAALATLDVKLGDIEGVVPAGALARIRGVVIWVSKADTACGASCYHPSADWLRANGYEPLKAGAVEFTNAQRLVDWSVTQPWMVLHELAHAYHHQVLGFGDADLEAKYREVVDAGVFNQVKYLTSTKLRPHYALTNPQEFFAEMSECYFGKNDFAPFDRSELHSQFSDIELLVTQKWAVAK
jgi:hypothetical protein